MNTLPNRLRDEAKQWATDETAHTLLLEAAARIEQLEATPKKPPKPRRTPQKAERAHDDAGDQPSHPSAS